MSFNWMWKLHGRDVVGYWDRLNELHDHDFISDYKINCPRPELKCDTFPSEEIWLGLCWESRIIIIIGAKLVKQILRFVSSKCVRLWSIDQTGDVLEFEVPVHKRRWILLTIVLPVAWFEIGWKHDSTLLAGFNVVVILCHFQTYLLHCLNESYCFFVISVVLQFFVYFRFD